MEKAAAAKRKLAGVNQHTRSLPVKLPAGSTGDTHDKVGAVIGMSGKTYERGKEVLAAVKSDPQRYATLKGVMDTKGVHTAYKAMRMIRGDEEPPTILREEDTVPGDYRELITGLVDAFKGVMVKHNRALEALRDGRGQWPEDRDGVLDSLEEIVGWARSKKPRLEVMH